MKITVKSSLLKSAISNLESLFSSALDSWDMEILISTEGTDKILLECSGGGAYYKQLIPATVDKKGKVAVNVDLMKNLNFPGETVTFLVKEKAMSFASGRMTGKIDAVGETDPVSRPKSFKEEDALIMPSKLFTRLVSSILFTPTVSDAAMKMRFQAKNKKQKLKVFSVDQYRLSRYEWKKPEEGEEEQMAPKEKEGKKKGAKPKKEKKEAREVMTVNVKGDFDYVFSSSFLSAIKGFFTGELRIAADSKLVRMSDESITLYCPSLQEDIGANTDSFIKEQEEKEPDLSLSFHPGHASDLIDAACSVNKNDDSRITMIPVPKEKQMQVRVTGDGVKTQCTFDVLSIKVGGKDSKVVLNATYFSEFLSLVRGFADEKKGCGMKVWEKCVVLHTPDSLYMMPTISQ